MFRRSHGNLNNQNLSRRTRKAKAAAKSQRLVVLIILVCSTLMLAGFLYTASQAVLSVDLSLLAALADRLDEAADSLEYYAAVQREARSTPTKNKETTKQDATTTTKTTSISSSMRIIDTVRDDQDDKDCIFRNSPISRKVFIYPNPGESGWKGDLLSEYGHNLTAMQWPWLKIDEIAKQTEQAHYDVNSQNVQYTTELLVREIMINPKSCLRTDNPEEATLFYVPYLPSTEHHVGHRAKTDYSTSPYGKAIMEILDNQNYQQWEQMFGLTSRYWKRRGGSDHILVFSEPMHGLYHPRSKRGHFHFIHTQKQLKPPIVISVELSSAFVKEYPKCSAKNILVPYPNTHGNFFNGVFQQEAEKLLILNNVTAATSSVALPAERQLFTQQKQQQQKERAQQPRPVAQFYQAGLHGTCTQLRKAMKQDYQECAPSHKVLPNILEKSHFSTAMRVVTFCPCPGGDSPSAKRHFDALIAGCIPIILSEDFVWPFTTEFDAGLQLDPSEFSLRLNANDYNQPLLDPTTCQPVDPAKPGLQALLESIPASEVARLREGVLKAGALYSWYANRPDLPVNPLRDEILPDGGTAHFVVQALAERAAGQRWPACEEELKQEHGKEANKFKC